MSITLNEKTCLSVSRRRQCPKELCDLLSHVVRMHTEQGSSASQMTAAKIMDVISRLPCCDGQAAGAVSAYTQVYLEDAPRLLKIPKSERPDVWIRLQTTQMTKIIGKN